MTISSILEGAAPGLLQRRSGAATRSRKAPFATQGALNVGSCVEQRITLYLIILISDFKTSQKFSGRLPVP